MREAQRSKTFKISGEIYQVCDATDPEAKEMSLLDIPPELLKLRNVTRVYYFEDFWEYLLIREILRGCGVR